jgi:exoribonuclease-2
VVPGQIVEFIEEGRVICAVCLEERKGRLRALTESMREVNLSTARLVHSSEERISLGRSREALARDLQRRSAQRQELANRIRVEEIWEVLREEKQEEYTPGELAELALGRTGDDETSAVIRAMLADRLYFKFRPKGFRPNDPETVEKILAQRSRQEEKERHIQHGAEWLRAIFAGRHEPPPAEREQIVETLKDYALYGKGARRAQAAEEMLRRAGLTHPLAPFTALVKMGVWSVDENLHLLRFGTRRSFPPDVLEQARALRELPPGAAAPEGREDLRDRPVYTIDDPHTRDIDDAVGIEVLPEGFRLGIYITDISVVIPKGSPLDREAALRATSIYLPEERIPMFPSEVSEGLCSLKEGESRPAVGLLVDTDCHGRLVNHRFCLCWIMVKRRMSYAGVDREVEDDPQGPLGTLFRIAQRWREERVGNGALLLPIPEVTVRVEGEEISLERRDRETPSQVLVSEMMILANRLAGTLLKEASVPAIYRAQGEPRERILDRAQQGDLLASYRQRRLLNRAEFLLDPAFHTGLGVGAYVTVTSPIRRFHDLVMQRQLVSCIRGEPPPYSREELQRILMDSEEVLAQAAQMEQARQRYWLLRYLEGKKGLTTQALVLGRYGNKVQILLPEFMLETSLPAASAPWLQEGMEIAVRIVRAKAMEDDLRVEPS